TARSSTTTARRSVSRSARRCSRRPSDVGETIDRCGERALRQARSPDKGGALARIVFTNANVLDGENPAIPDSTVVVEGDRVVQVANGNGAVEIGPEDRVIDCSGLTLMPGMTTGHYHSTYHNVTVPINPPLGLESPPPYQAYVA